MVCLVSPLVGGVFSSCSAVGHTHTEEYYTTIKKNEILPFGTTWIDLKGIMLSEINQTEKDKYCMIILIGGI